MQVSPTLFSLIKLYFFSSKNLFVNPWSLCLIFTRLFTMLSTNLIKMYRVTRNILTQYKQNSIKSAFPSVLIFCLHSVKVCIDISITQHALIPLKPRWSWSLHQILNLEYCTFRVQIVSLNSLRCCSLNFFSRSPPLLGFTKQRFSTKYCVHFHCFRCRWANT